MAAVSSNDPRPPYMQIADELRRAISAGELKPGERLESGRNMARRFGVAQMTLHNAITALKDAGYLVSWQGRGVFVADPLPTRGVDLVTQVEALRAEVNDLKQRVAVLEGAPRSR